MGGAAYFVKDKVTQEYGGKKVTKEVEELSNEREFVKVEGDFSVPCGLMMKVLHEDVRLQEGEVMNFNLLMRQDMSSKDDEL